MKLVPAWGDNQWLLCQLSDLFLDRNKTPKFACIEIIYVTATHVIRAFAACGRRPFKRILAQVHNGRHVGCDLFSRPSPWLLEELILEIIDADSSEMRSAKVKDFMSR